MDIDQFFERFKIPQEHRAKFEDAMSKLNLEKPHDVVNYSLTLLFWSIAELGAGKHIGSYDPVSREMTDVRIKGFELLGTPPKGKPNLKIVRD